MKKTAKNKTTINTREELIYALCEAAEIEHGLTCAYLFTAFSMKRFLDEGIDEIQQDKIRNWKSVILRVAHQEMEHLGIVCNMLNAIGGPQHFNRPNFPQSKKYYQTAVDLQLAKFSLDTMAAYMAFEKPEITPGDNYKLNGTQIVPEPILIHDGHTVQELYEAILNGFITLNAKGNLFIGNPKSQVIDDDIVVGFSNKEYGVTMEPVTNLDEAKKAIKLIIEQGEGVILQGEAVLTENKALTKLYEAFDKHMDALNKVVFEEADWTKSIKQAAADAKAIATLLKAAIPHIKTKPAHQAILKAAYEVVDNTTRDLETVSKQAYSKAHVTKAGKLRDTLNQAAINDAEGVIIYEIVKEKDCHYIKFWEVYQDLKVELSKSRGFNPSRAVVNNPMLRRHEDTLESKAVHIVDYPYTRKVLELFNAGYETMVDMLIIYFANSGVSKAEKSVLVNTAFFPFMTMFIRPVGELLSMLPATADAKKPLDAPRAGGSFEFYINNALMPRTQPSWIYLNERIEQMVALSKTIQKPDSELKKYMPAPSFKYLTERMEFLFTNLKRISENFASGMNIKS